jgi:outer membrane protein TolC
MPTGCDANSATQMNPSILTSAVRFMVVVLIGTPSIAHAGPALSLTLRSAVEKALKQNPDVRSSRERINEGDQSLSFAFSQALPNVSATASATVLKAAVNNGINNLLFFNGAPYRQYAVQFRVAQPIYVGGAIGSGLDAARKEIDVRRKDLEVAERDLSVNVLQTYNAVLLNRELLKILKETESVLSQLVKTNEGYQKIGRTQLLDVLQSRTQLALLKPRITQTENQMQTTALQLATLLHEPAAESIDLTGKFSTLTRATVDQLFRSRLPELPELTRIHTQISQFEDQTNVQLAQFRPQLNLIGTIGRAGTRASLLVDDLATTWGVGLQLSVPIFVGLGSIHQKNLLGSQKAQLEYGEQRLQDAITLNQGQSDRDLETADAVLKSSEVARQLANQSLEEAKRNYRVKSINPLQFLTSQQNYLDAESAYHQAKFNHVVAVSRYAVAMGIPMATIIEALESQKGVL